MKTMVSTILKRYFVVYSIITAVLIIIVPAYGQNTAPLESNSPLQSTTTKDSTGFFLFLILLAGVWVVN